mmetsp:Transcript_3727/g.5590  ORF Transcript_3727/g.5590 Transcript_3727/m.5590 type:complete len:349 (-) Transcript_3727:834-1880(-)
MWNSTKLSLCVISSGPDSPAGPSTEESSLQRRMSSRSLRRSHEALPKACSRWWSASRVCVSAASRRYPSSTTTRLGSCSRWSAPSCEVCCCSCRRSLRVTRYEYSTRSSCCRLRGAGSGAVRCSARMWAHRLSTTLLRAPLRTDSDEAKRSSDESNTAPSESSRSCCFADWSPMRPSHALASSGTAQAGASACSAAESKRRMSWKLCARSIWTSTACPSSAGKVSPKAGTASAAGAEASATARSAAELLLVDLTGRLPQLQIHDTAGSDEMRGAAGVGCGAGGGGLRVRVRLAMGSLLGVCCSATGLVGSGLVDAMAASSLRGAKAPPGDSGEKLDGGPISDKDRHRL